MSTGSGYDKKNQGKYGYHSFWLKIRESGVTNATHYRIYKKWMGSIETILPWGRSDISHTMKGTLVL